MKTFLAVKVSPWVVALVTVAMLNAVLLWSVPAALSLLLHLCQGVILLMAAAAGYWLKMALSSRSTAGAGTTDAIPGQAYFTLRNAINSQQDALLAVDAAGRILLANDAARKLFFIDQTAAPLLTPEWPAAQGLFVPGTSMVFPFEEMPLFRALKGESGGPTRIFLRNDRNPDGCMLSYRYMPMQSSGDIEGALCIFSDITELDRLQTAQTHNLLALQETQRRLLDAQKLGGIGIWELNLATKALWLSPEMRALCGVPEDAAGSTAEKLLALIHPDDHASCQSLHQAARLSGEPLTTEYRVVLADGKTRWMHQFERVQKNSFGQPAYRIGVVQEITSRKNAELEIARSTAMLNRTGDIAKIAGWEIDVQTWESVYSDAIYHLHEIEPPFVFTPRIAVGFYAKEARPAVRAALQAALDHGTAWDLELPLITARGRRLWVRTQGKVLLKDGQVCSLIGVLHDITEQRAAQDQLRLLETCISRLNDVVVITEAQPLDAPGPRTVFVNDAYERMTGYSRAEALASTPRLAQGSGTQRAELDKIRAALETWQPVQAEILNYTKSGKSFWLDLHIVPVANNQGVYTHWVAIQRNITERKLAEQNLLESQHRYAALFDTAPVAMWIHSSESLRFLQVNQTAVDAYGYSATEFADMAIFDIWPDAIAAQQVLLLQQPKPPLASSFCWQHRRRDGSFFPVNVQMRPIQDRGVAACFVVVLDISAQLQAEKEVQSYLFTLQRAADATRAISWHQTLAGTLQEVADQARLVIGCHHAMVSLTTGEYGLQSTQALSVSDKYPQYRELPSPLDGTSTFALVCQHHRSLRMGQTQISALAESQNYADHAHQHPAMQGWLAVALTGRDGKNIGLLQLSDKYQGDFTQQDEYVVVELAQLASIALEKTQLIQEVSQLNAGLEKKVAERTAALAQQEAKFRALADEAPEIVWTVNPRGAITYVNKAWFDLAGGTWDDWLEGRWHTAIHPEDLPAMQANWKRALAEGAEYKGLRRIRSKDGSWHTTSYRSTPVLDAQGSVLFWVGIDTDISEIKATEAALRLSNQELEAFSYSVSHDLRGPLNTIDGFSRLLAKQLASSQPVQERQQHYLSRIQAGVAQMGKLIEDLLSLAQFSRVQLVHRAVDVSQIAKSILDEHAQRHPERQVTVQIAPGLQAYGDSRLLSAALENLLGNAWKFTAANPLAMITVGQLEENTNSPVFFVRDNGAGFDMAYADKLFVPFQRLHTASEFSGTGIGLATVSRIINRHGGQVWAEAVPGAGATFYFTLPKLPVVL